MVCPCLYRCYIPVSGDWTKIDRFLSHGGDDVDTEMDPEMSNELAREIRFRLPLVQATLLV